MLFFVFREVFDSECFCRDSLGFKVVINKKDGGALIFIVREDFFGIVSSDIYKREIVFVVDSF